MTRVLPAGGAILAMAGMGGFYAAVLWVLGGGWGFVVWQTEKIWPWLAAVLLTFGFQVYWAMKVRQAGMAAAGGGGSAAAMIACCAHHVSEVLPLAGLVTGASLVVKYQILLMAAAVVINLAGAGIMYRKYRKSAV